MIRDHWRLFLFVGIAGAMVGSGLRATNPAPVAYTVPTYGARLSDDAGSREMLAELRKIRIAVEAMQRAQQAFERPPASLKALVTERCAKCHGESVADKLGSAFVLLNADGTVPPFSLAEKRRIIRETKADRMPKDKPLTDLEKTSLEQFLFPKEEVNKP